MAAKYYAVKEGRKKGIYRTWADCKAQTDGYSGAVYKSFKTEKEALEFMSGTVLEEKTKSTPTQTKSDEIPEREAVDEVIAYVDGSYLSDTGEFSYGMVVLRDGKEYCFSKKMYDKELSSMNNVAGEIKGAEAAMQYAVDEGLESITIYHDYEGIARWCLGDWKTNKEGTKAYKQFYDGIKGKVHVTFRKVKGHSGDKYNDMVDMLAKKALGIR